jgi:hypothetical protein
MISDALIRHPTKQCGRHGQLPFTYLSSNMVLRYPGYQSRRDSGGSASAAKPIPGRGMRCQSSRSRHAVGLAKAPRQTRAERGVKGVATLG